METKIVVGIPSFNEADSIGNVVSIIDAGLSKTFMSQECVIVNVDNNSSDGTRSAFLTTETKCSKHFINTGGENRGKGKNLLSLFGYSHSIGAKVTATFDADLLTIEPSWVPNLISPVTDGACDYVCPLYSRNRFEGSITNHLALPLICAVFGITIRQPIGGEFALSKEVVDYLLSRTVPPTAFQYGIDIFMTLHSIGGGFKIGESFLGKKFHKPSFPKIMPMFTQVSQTALECISSYWRVGHQTVRYINLKPPSRVGIDDKAMFPHKEKAKKLMADATERFKRLKEEYLFFLEDFYLTIERRMLAPEPVFSAEDWSEVLYRFLSKFADGNLTANQRERCGDLLSLIFIRRAVVFWLEAESMTAQQVECRIIKQAETMRQRFATMQ
ncbi:MAG: glycosyltransferase [Minisyncoccia bacterium]